MSTGPNDDERAATELALTEQASAQTLPRGDGPVVVARAFIGRFRIDAELGSGGMADVYRAYDPVLDRAVALKVLHTKQTVGDTQGMRRVLREARAAAALTHPNTVTIFEVGEADDEVFIAMELLEGSVLREVIDRGTASLEDKLRWLLQGARALAAAHERGLVHRDVKPENMFVCADGSLKLLDFGIAKRDADDGDHGEAEHAVPSSLRTHAGRRLGTPRYMAPEQHAGTATDARTDEYAWGLVAFELLCGSLVVEEERTAAGDGGVAPAGASGDMRLAELRAKVPELSDAIAASIARALEPEKEERFPSMAPIIVALEARATVEDRTTRARPLWWIGATAAAVSVVVLILLVTLREPAGIGQATVAPGPTKVLPPACRTVSTRFLHLAPRERLAVLPDGAVVFMRDPVGKLTLERETPTGTRPLALHPMPLASGVEPEDTWVQGMMFRDASAIFTGVNPGRLDRPLSLIVVSEHRVGAISVDGVPRAFAATSFGNDIVAAVASMADSRFGVPPGLALHRVGDGRATHVEGGAVEAPSVAATPTRLGVAYQHVGETHFVLFDLGLSRVGDVVTAMPFLARTAVAFAGATATLFWADTRSAKTRLTVATFSPGDASFGAPTVATDDPLIAVPPLTARMADGSFVVAWLTSNGGPPTLRVSPVGAGGLLTGPSDLATEERFVDVHATPTPRGIDFTWHDGAGGARIAHVVCQPPISL